MFSKFSRGTSTLAAAAALSMALSPVAAQARGWGGGWGGGWGRHHDDIDAGDIFAGILIIGGIAAIASAASKANRDNRARTDARTDDRYPDSRDGRDYRNPAPRYGQRDDRPSWQEGRGIDGAVNTCVGEVERGSSRVDSVDAVNRDAQGWRVEGRTSGGRPFACAIDGDGRVRSVTVDGRAAFAGERAPSFVSEPVVQPTTKG